MADGQLHRFVNIYINDEDIRYLQRSRHPGLRPATSSLILPGSRGGLAA